MKKFYSTIAMLAMMVAALSFTACGSDDDEIDNGGDSNASIVGTWELISFDVVKGSNYLDDGLNTGDRITFKSDGTYYSTDGDRGIWKLNGNTLTISDDENLFSIDYQVKKLSSTELRLYVDIEIAAIDYKFKRVS